MNTTLQYMNQIHEATENQVGVSLANSTTNERLDRYYIPVGLFHPRKPKKQSVMKGGAIPVPTPTYVHKGQYGGTASDAVMGRLLDSVRLIH